MSTKSEPIYRRVARLGSAAALAMTLTASIALVPTTASAHEGHGAPQSGHQTDHGSGYHTDHRARRNMTHAELRRLAEANGYAEGFQHGQADRRSRAGFNYQHDEAYRSATVGYDARWGSRWVYQSAFRQSYRTGYSDAFYGRARSRAHQQPRVLDYRNSPYDPYANLPSYRRNPYNPNGGPGYSEGSYDPRYRDNRERELDREEVVRRAAQQGYYDGFRRGQADLNQGIRRGNPTGHGAYEHGLNGFDADWGSAASYKQAYRQYFVQGYEAGFGRRTFDRRYERRGW